MKFYAEFISRKRKRKNIPKYSEFKEARYFKLQTGQKINILLNSAERPMPICGFLSEFRAFEARFLPQQANFREKHAREQARIIKSIISIFLSPACKKHGCVL